MSPAQRSPRTADSPSHAPTARIRVAPSWSDRLAPAVEFARLVRDRRQYLLAPLLLAIVALLVFMTAAEMPVLIPFFYAVF
jgi:hypothetical protein